MYSTTPLHYLTTGMSVTSPYTSTEEHRQLAALFDSLGGELQALQAALAEEQWARYRVHPPLLRHKLAKDAAIFACHMIAGDYSRSEPDSDGDDEEEERGVGVVPRNTRGE